MDLTNVSELRSLLERHGIQPTKALGQHFLCSRSVVESIVKRVTQAQGILEIGPGPGALTSQLVIGRTVTAIELDNGMLSVLSETAPSVRIVHADVLKTDLNVLLLELPKPRSVVSNMPYSITGPLLGHIAASRQHFDRAILMMQKEVADRVVAQAGNSNRGSLSVFLQSQFEIFQVARAPAGAFFPPPKVDSMVLEFVPRVSAELTPSFFHLIRKSFSMPRKTLANNLIAAHLVLREDVGDVLTSVGLREDIRPHILTVDQWVELDRQLELNGLSANGD